MSDEAEIQKWREYAENPKEIKRPVLNNCLLVGTINTILKERGISVIELHEIHDPSAEETKTFTEHIKSVLKKIKIPKITKIENPREKVNRAYAEINEITNVGEFNEQFGKLIDELIQFTKNSFPGIAIEYSQKKIKKWFFFDSILHIIEFKFKSRTGTTIYSIENENFNNLITDVFITERLINYFRTMFNDYEFFEFQYYDNYMKIGHTIFVYVNNEEKHIIGDFNIDKRIFDIQDQIAEYIQEGTLEYNVEKNNKDHIKYLVALYELIIVRLIGKFGYTLEDLPIIQEGPVCQFWMFFRMVFHNLTREELIEKLAIAAETIGFELNTENIEAIMVVMVREMLNNPEIKQQEKIADSITGFGLNKKNKK